ncbi:MAG: NUDIX domain-containing protein [Alphaproteobacteria bacterium]|nr:NUDIX domain-containing protein [Alphaproteobacteria bacterium]MCW5739347.1 NUDIX domain-containing protein [Alphaproteobacteria bacterium]
MRDRVAARLRLKGVETLHEGWSKLRRATFDWLRRDGRWQELRRETYDRGDGVAVLLRDRARGTILLTRQFRYPTWVNGHHGMMIEVCAGRLDGADPVAGIGREIEEETGYAVSALCEVMQVFPSPGSVTERLHLFVGDYDASRRVSAGGGAESEGEDIELIETTLEEALAMVARGEILDAKTIILLQHARLNGLA